LPDKIHEQSRPALPLPDRPAIAVLPFVNMSGEPEQEYFSDGISEDIITALSKLRWFFVIARNSSFIYKGKAAHLKEIAEKLGVGYVVEGSVRKGGDRVRITVQLNDVATGSHIWAERYDRDLSDVFALQDEITEAIVAAIEPQLYAAENFRAQRKPPDSMDAWDLVMRALSHYWRVTRQDNVVAQALLEKAIAIEQGATWRLSTPTCACQRLRHNRAGERCGPWATIWNPSREHYWRDRCGVRQPRTNPTRLSAYPLPLRHIDPARIFCSMRNFAA
jgi:TolB-like protein